MLGKVKLGIASALMFAIVATPALGCVIYIAQSRAAHICCPQEKPKGTVLTRCCVYSPAIAAQTTDVAASTITASAPVAIEPTKLTSDFEWVIVPSLDTSPPGCNSVLRI